jgi:hypothetical protein
MTQNAQTSDSAAPLSIQTESAQTPKPHSIWFGPNGLRAGWRLLIYAVPMVALGFGLNFGLRAIFGQHGMEGAIGQNP